MAGLRFEVTIEPLPPLPDPMVVLVLEGITYRAEILGGSARAYRARLLEPFQEAFGRELPLFVLGLTSFRFVSGGRPTEHLWKVVRQDLEGFHHRARLASDLEVERALAPGRLEGLVREAQAGIREQEALAAALEARLQPLRLAEAADRSRLRRAIQKRVKDGLLTQAASLPLLADPVPMDEGAAEAARVLQEEARALQAAIEVCRNRSAGIEVAFQAGTRWPLAVVAQHLARRS
jgi:hypothetical protein